MTFALTVHTERLSSDEVWGYVRRMLALWEQHGIQATFFCVAPVHPYYRSQPGFSEARWARRIDEIAGRGHAIGQHTHFYGAEGKTWDVSAENLHERLDEDRRWLQAQGLAPAGFVGGGWTINAGVFRFLLAHGYRYDCSARSFSLAYLEGRGQTMVAQHPFWVDAGRLRLLEIPSTAPVIHLAYSLLPFAGQRTCVDVPRWGKYTLIYLHDYDLLNPRFRVVLCMALHLLRLRHAEWVTVDVLCDALSGIGLPVRTLEEADEADEYIREYIRWNDEPV